MERYERWQGDVVLHYSSFSHHPTRLYHRTRASAGSGWCPSPPGIDSAPASSLSLSFSLTLNLCMYTKALAAIMKVEGLDVGIAHQRHRRAGPRRGRGRRKWKKRRRLACHHPRHVLDRILGSTKSDTLIRTLCPSTSLLVGPSSSSLTVSVQRQVKKGALLGVILSVRNID